MLTSQAVRRLIGSRRERCRQFAAPQSGAKYNRKTTGRAMRVKGGMYCVVSVCNKSRLGAEIVCTHYSKILSRIQTQKVPVKREKCNKIISRERNKLWADKSSSFESVLLSFLIILLKCSVHLITRLSFVKQKRVSFQNNASMVA